MAKESTFKNMAVTLFAVCLVASAALGGIYTLTKAPIAAAESAKINEAISKVTPEFNNNPSSSDFTKEIDLDGKKSTVYTATKDGAVVGYAIKSTTSKGFGGNITVMVGFDTEGTIVGTSVISHAETPGLGAKIDMTDSHFIVQFNGKNPADPNFKLAVKKDNGSVDAITASTITSRAYCDVIEIAYKAFLNVKSEEAQGE